jgi:hypothetical protein
MTIGHRRPPEAALLRLVARGGGVAAGAGATVGLVVGLVGYPPTAWFAAIELGVPAGVVGALLTGLVGTVVLGVRAIVRR